MHTGSKIEYKHYNFSKKQKENALEVKMEDVMQQVSMFKYMGSIVQNDGKVLERCHVQDTSWVVKREKGIQDYL